MKYLALSVAILAGAFFVACGSRSESLSGTDTQKAVASNASEPLAPELVADREKQMNASANTAMKAAAPPRRAVRNVIQTTSLAEAQTVRNAPVSTERKVIRNADLLLETGSPEDALNRIVNIAAAKGGYIVESQQSSSDLQVKKRDTVSATLRVPADRFNDALNEIKNTADTVVTESVKGEDVTEEFIDVEARLTAQKALEQQYIEIMKRAYSVEDALYVQSELAEVRGEIEKIEGRKRYLENQSSLSTITVKLQTPAVISAGTATFGKRLSESFGTGVDFALNFVLGLVTILISILPFAIFILLPGYFAGRIFWRRRTRPLSVAEIAKEEIRSE